MMRRPILTLLVHWVIGSLLGKMCVGLIEQGYDADWTVVLTFSMFFFWAVFTYPVAPVADTKEKK